MENTCQLTLNPTDVNLLGEVTDKMPKDNTIFRSTTRLYTNFHDGEHNQDRVINAVKTTLHGVSVSLEKFITDDFFVEAILKGGDAVDFGVPANRNITWHVRVPDLDPSDIKWGRKLVSHPKAFIKRIALVLAEDGTMCIDVDVELRLSNGIAKRLFSESTDTKEYRGKKATISAINNLVTGCKYLFFDKLQRALKTTPGVEIEDMCDILTVEIRGDDHSECLERLLYNVEDESMTSKIWEASLDKIG
jgi:hypothetical protein